MVKPITSSLDTNFKFQSNTEPTIECINFNFNKHIVDGNHTHFKKKTFFGAIHTRPLKYRREPLRFSLTNLNRIPADFSLKN